MAVAFQDGRVGDVEGRRVSRREDGVRGVQGEAREAPLGWILERRSRGETMRRRTTGKVVVRVEDGIHLGGKGTTGDMAVGDKKGI